ncbi:hypothetical protein DFH07DRAFT_940007 [Mycena maculata]|uniref:Uncharacterized protein n=1 Tax=Mycena maculata TaxID=230809 RepID=A0AAD7JD21_9AGAR|nr:hypothetical protein DFH07DRAFT_940007 [Mycena maculata]
MSEPRFVNSGNISSHYKLRIDRTANPEPHSPPSFVSIAHIPMSPSPVFSSTTTAEEVATAFAADIKGKNVLITGTSINGIGFETALAIARHASLVVISGYNAERLELSEDAIKKEVPGANIHRLILNLSSLVNVRKAAAQVNAYPEPLHVLVHNAAAPVASFKLTVDGLENQFATDHVGPFLLRIHFLTCQIDLCQRGLTCIDLCGDFRQFVGNDLGTFSQSQGISRFSRAPALIFAMFTRYPGDL